MNVGCELTMSRRCFLRTSTLAAAVPVLGGALDALPPNEEPHPAKFWKRLEGQNVQCGLCPRGCVIPLARRGHCGVRENRNGRLVSLVYGHPCSINDDPIEKKPFFHVYPGSRALSLATVGCNIECKFCQNWDISQASPDDISSKFLSPSDIATLARKQGAKTVAYTYSEPTVFCEYVLDCAKAARDVGIGSVVVSNGFISAEALKEVCSVVTAVKIDLKAFSETFYRNVCDGRLQPVLDTLKRLAASGVWFEIVVLIIPTLNDNPDEIRRLSAWVAKEVGAAVPIHFTRFHPAYKLQNLPSTPPRTIERAREIAMSEGIRFAYTGNMPGGEGENTYCPSCKARLVQRYGAQVLSNRLKGNKCPDCAAAIPGVWI